MPPSATGGVPMGSLLLLVGGVLAVVAALLARSGFTGRDHVIGVDLGTTYSVVAISQRGNVSVIADAQGDTLLPSTVAFLPGGGVLVGREARAHRTRDPQRTVFNAKRFIGQPFDAVKAADLAAPYEFRVASQDGDACFVIDAPGHPWCVTPVVIGALVVDRLMLMARRFVGHDQITKAVIAVPVDFNERQRDATVAAFRGAGLLVSRVLEEPTAAAIAYGLHQDPAVHFVLVFDFGGGTLDVSLLYARAGSIRVVDTLGDNSLGGEDVDAMVAEYLSLQFAAQLGMEKIPSVALKTLQSEDDGADGERDGEEGGEEGGSGIRPPCTQAGVRRAAETLKRALSSNKAAAASCVALDDSDMPQNLHGSAVAAVEMTREELEELCRPLLERTMAPVRAILTGNHMEPEEIDAVVLVGGSSRIPWIRERLTELFGGRQPLTDIDPDVAVAYGAARVLD